MLDLNLEAFIYHDDYDYDDQVISVTRLINGVQRIILEARADALEQEQLKGLPKHLHTQIGTAIHKQFENIWLEGSYKAALVNAGYPQHFIDSIRVVSDPAKMYQDPDLIYVLPEYRFYKTLLGTTISGMADNIIDHTVYDLKTTNPYYYTPNNPIHIKQLSYLRYLSDGIITNDLGYIDYLFKEWNMQKIGQDDYPVYQAISEAVELMPIQQVETEILHKLDQIDRLMDAPAEQLPNCSEDETGDPGFVWKYYTKASNVRATKVFPSYHAAKAYNYQRKKGVIKRVSTKRLKCEFCKGKELCIQYASILLQQEKPQSFSL